MRRRHKRIVLRTGEVSSETTYAITTLCFPDTGATGLEQLRRGCWMIEDRVRPIRYGTMG